MAEYSIDDILAELDKKKSDGGSEPPKKTVSDDSLNDILSGNYKSESVSSKMNKVKDTPHVGTVTEILNEEEIKSKLSEAGILKTQRDKKAVKKKPDLPQKKVKSAAKPVLKEETQELRMSSPPTKVKDETLVLNLDRPKKTAADIPGFHPNRNPFSPKPKKEEKPDALEMTEKTEETEKTSEKFNSAKSEVKKEQPEVEVLLNETGAFSIVDESIPFEKKKESSTTKTVQIDVSQRELTQTAEIRRKERIERLKAEQLQKDSELETPEDLLDAVNPFEIKEKIKAYKSSKPAEEKKPNVELNTDIIEMPAFSTLYAGDTKGIAGDDLKQLMKSQKNKKSPEPITEEVVKKEPKKDKEPQKVEDENRYAVLTEKEKRSNTALIQKLNKSLEEKRKSDIAAYRTITLAPENLNLNPLKHGLNIDYEKQIIAETGTIPLQEDPVLAQQKLESLSANKKHKIRDFVLSDSDETDIEQEDESDETEFDDYDSTGQIWADLCASHKGLKVRCFLLFLITALVIFISVLNDLKIDGSFSLFGNRINIFDKRLDMNGYIIFHLIIGTLGFGLCSSVISSGISKLFSLKPDCDSICAVSSVVALIGGIVNLAGTDALYRNSAYLYISAALLMLLFNTIGKLFMIVRAKRNFRFISGDSQKYYACKIDDENTASIFTKGVVSKVPFLVTMRKTEFLSDFLKSSYCDDKADKISRKLTLVGIIAAVLFGAFAYINPMNKDDLTNNGNWAFTVATAVLMITSPLSIMLIVNIPLDRASKALSKTNSTVLGYNVAEEFSQTNSVIVNANVLFPAGSVTLKNLKRCQKKNAVNNILIDEAILLAASLAIHSNSIMSSMFYDVIGGDKSLLSKVENCIYEDNMGISGWIGSRRMMLGNREQMKSHHIEIPDRKKVRKYCSDSSEVVYLAVGGEIVAMIIVEILANNGIKSYMNELEEKGVSVIVKTNDSLVTVQKLAELFEVEPTMLKILTHSSHEKYDECTKYTSRGKGGISCNGTFSSFAQAVLAAKTLIKDINLSAMLMIQSVALGVILTLIFMLFGFTNWISPTFLMSYNLITTLIIVVVQRFRRY